MILILLLVFWTGCKDYNRSARILFIGDSWGALMCLFDSFSAAMKELGYSSAERSLSCLETTQPQTKARTWATPSELNRISKSLDEHPQVKFIYISLGGNDFFEIWNKNMSLSEKQKAFRIVQNNFRIIINKIREKNKSAKIILSSYDYGNFEYLMTTKFADAYVNVYQHMGYPTALEMQTAMNEFEKYKQALVHEYNNLTYVNLQGLMQVEMGISEYNIPANTLPLPEQGGNFTPGGRLDLWGPPQAFLGIPNTMYNDPYHLNPTGFYKLVRYLLMQAPMK